MSTSSIPMVLKVNQEYGECQWAVPHKSLQPCEFNFSHREPIEGLSLYGKNIEIVKIPAGRKLYHATIVYPGMTHWFETGFRLRIPIRRVASITESAISGSIKGSWFASTIDHAKNIPHTHMLEVELKEDLTLLFIQNIKTIYNSEKGKNLFRPGSHFMKNIEILKKYYVIDGYVGCNECEIFVKDTSYYKLGMPTVLYKKDISYIGGSRKMKKIRHHKTRKTRK